MRPESDSSFYRKLCRSCGEAVRANYDWDGRCERCRASSLGVGGPQRRRHHDESPGDHGHGSYYTHAMTAADQGHST
jgi:hypothetical protein